MKKIKLALLAAIMVVSAIGAYGSYRSAAQMYNIVPHTLSSATSYQVAASSPSPNCGGNAAYVCTALGPNGYSSGQFIPAPDCVVASEYN